MTSNSTETKSKKIKLSDDFVKHNSTKPTFEIKKKTNKNGKFKKVEKTSFSKQKQDFEKTDWKLFKDQKKNLRLKRKQQKQSSETSSEAKKIYEKLKCKKSENKTDLVCKLYNLVCGDVLRKFVMAHDTARIIQCMLKFASPTLRENISSELMPISVDMATSKYASFCVLRMFKYGSPKTKQNLIESFYGNIVKLASHNISHKILDHAYLFVATENQKAFMRQEFYGDLYKNAKDMKVRTLVDCYKETEQMKTAILSSVKSNLEHIANKNLVDNSIIHSILMEYLKEIEDVEKKEDIISIYGPLIPHLLTTKDGCIASMDCFYHSPAKNRRAIVKVIKDHLTKICIHEHGHIFLIAVLNSMDDTKAIKKSLFDPIYTNIQEIVGDKWGRRVIEWFIAPAEKDFIHPHMLKILDEGLKFGKKDKLLRRKEIQEQVEGPISDSIVVNPKLYLRDGHMGLFTASILNKREYY
ncbi:KIAA0020 family protein [Megaselia abdita]